MFNLPWLHEAQTHRADPNQRVKFSFPYHFYHHSGGESQIVAPHCGGQNVKMLGLVITGKSLCQQEMLSVICIKSIVRKSVWRPKVCIHASVSCVGLFYLTGYFIQHPFYNLWWFVIVWSILLSHYSDLTTHAFLFCKLEGQAQYVIETRDAVQMRAWLSDIRSSIHLRYDVQFRFQYCWN